MLLSRDSVFGKKTYFSTMNDGVYEEPKELPGIISISMDETIDFKDDKVVYKKEKFCPKDVKDIFSCTLTLDNCDGLDDLTQEYVETNCKNCGAAVRGSYCEYCGTRYETIKKFGIYINGHDYS